MSSVSPGKARLVITVDGPSGAGKTTVSKRLAQGLGYIHLDTGALYRVVALAVKEAGIDPDCEERLSHVCSRLDVQLKNRDNTLAVFLHGRDVTHKIRTPEISLLASRVSAKAVVRETLLGIQRKIGEGGGVVAEGRDAGTVVFPQASVKFYLDADLETRGARRYKELESMGTDVTLSKTIEQIRKRDENDSGRELAPLKPAEDAIYVDTGPLTIEEVTDTMTEVVRKRCAALHSTG
jgi:cytidylate kinase